MSLNRHRIMAPAALLVAVALSVLLPRPDLGQFERASGFKVQNAFLHLRVIAREPHPIGSLANEAVRNYILRTLRRLPVEVSEQRTSVTTHMAGSTAGATVRNVVCRIPGRDAQQSAIALVAHYDSGPSSPGASDNGASVAALLETARALASGPLLRRDIYLLFTDGEEHGLLGAEAFVREHPAAKRVGVFLNFDARGTRGPVLLFQTSGRNGATVGQFADGVLYPSGHSLFSTLSQLLPNATDAIPLAASGAQTLGFAFAEGIEHYHRPTDSVNELSPVTLAQVGAYATELARHFGQLEGLPQPATDCVYFDLLGRWLCHYANQWAAGLGVFCALAWVYLARRSERPRRILWRGLATGAMTLGMALLCGFAVPVGFTFLCAALMSESRWVNSAPWVGLSALLITVGTLALWQLRTLRSMPQRDLVLGMLGVAAVVALLLGWFVPGASAVWQWSTATLLLTSLWQTHRCHGSQATSSWPLLIAIVINALLTVPVVAMALRLAGPVLTLVPVLIGLLHLALLLPVLLPEVTRWGQRTAYGLILVGLCLLVGILGSGGTQTVTVNLATTRGRPPTPTSIEVQRLSGDATVRTLNVRMAAADGTRCVNLQQLSGPKVSTLTVNNKPVSHMVRFSPELDELGVRIMSGSRSRSGYRFSYCNLENDPLDLGLRVHGPGTTELRVTEDVDETARPTEGTPSTSVDAQGISERWVPDSTTQVLRL